VPVQGCNLPLHSTFTGIRYKKFAHNTAEHLRPDKNRCKEGPTFLLSASGTVLHTRVYCEIVWHFESNERHGKVCVLYYGPHHCQSYGLQTRYLSLVFSTLTSLYC
jgi:hypothetical protein